MIKIDIEMPINCIKCPCSSYEYWWCCELEGCDLSEAELKNNRPDWCPLIEFKKEIPSTQVIGIKDNKFLDIHENDVIISDTENGKRYLRVVYGSPLQEFNFDGCWCGWDLQNEEVIPLFQLQGTPLIVGNVDDKEIYDKWENGVLKEVENWKVV